MASPTAPPIAFGPVPSRRLGRSLGVNNVPPKSCSYSCVYCQVGRTTDARIVPRGFHDPDALVAAVSERVAALRRRDEAIDHITFVPDGEPCLDRNLAAEITALRALGLPIAVISNGSLLADPATRRALAMADWVPVKVDTVDAATWQRINRPHPGLQLDAVLDGIARFAAGFRGELATETMLVAALNDDEPGVAAVAEYVAHLRPRTACLAVPTRPPAEPAVQPPDETVVHRAYLQFATRLPNVELLTRFEGTDFGAADDPVVDLLATVAVHPMREDAARQMLGGGADGQARLAGLVTAGRLRRVLHLGHAFYMPRLRRERR